MTALTTVRDEAAAFAAAFDPSRVSTFDAFKVLQVASSLKSIAAAIEARAAARAAESPSWQKDGAKSAAERLARTTGVSVGQAAATIATGQRLEELPEVRSAANAGRLSPAQLVPVAEAAHADPRKARQLLHVAETAPLGTLRDACREVRLSTEGDPEARRAKIRGERYLRPWTDRDGAGRLDVKDNPEVIASVMAGLADERERIFQENKRNGTYASPEALDLDALVAKVTSGTTAEPVRRTRRRGAREKVLIRVDLPTLLRGRPVEGERCEIVGYGPVAVSAVTEIIDSGSAFIAAVLTKAEQVLGVAHLGRGPNPAQQTALEWLSPTCSNEACQTPYDIELDHVFGKEWAATHTTKLEDIAPMCGHDHDLKTYKGWALVDGTGKRAFVPPEDPRHPRHQQAVQPPPDP